MWSTTAEQRTRSGLHPHSLLALPVDLKALQKLNPTSITPAESDEHKELGNSASWLWLCCRNAERLRVENFRSKIRWEDYEDTSPFGPKRSWGRCRRRLEFRGTAHPQSRETVNKQRLQSGSQQNLSAFTQPKKQKMEVRLRNSQNVESMSGWLGRET